MRVIRFKEKINDAFNIENDTASHEVIRERIVDGGMVTGSNLWILVLAIFIASIGLNMNSTAVIIGAMLISPLMGSILTAAYATATVDPRLFRRAISGFLFQIAVCLLTSTLYFMISPISSTTSELLARTQPTIWDVLIAAFGGLAGIIGITRKEKSNVIPGVAIATALMPPLCTCGYGIATGQIRYIAGAFYLFLVNSYFIFLASAAILLALKIPRERDISKELWNKVKKGVIRNTIVMMIPSIIVAINMVAAEQAESSSITGFESSYHTEQMLVDQIEILFPEIVQVEFSDSVIYEKGGSEPYSRCLVTVEVSKEFNESSLERLSQWLSKVYEKDCVVQQKIISTLE